MATIVNFRPAEISAQSTAQKDGGATCEIILFPGVRYERWEEPPQPRRKASASGRKSRAKKRELEMAE